MREYLAEGIVGAFPFIVDRSKPFVTESRSSGGTVTRIPGRFSVCDCINGNNRRYTKRVWEKNLKDGSTLSEAIKRNAAFGLLEHPKDGVVTLESPISHQVVSAKLVESKDVEGKTIHEVVGEIALYDFGEIYIPEARKLRALIEGGYNPLVSSRGYGSLKKAADGVDEVDEDYVCEGWDVVIKPSFSNAELIPNRGEVQSHAESKPAPAAPAEKSLAESKTNLKENSPSSGAASAAASVTKPKVITMNVNEIKSRITALRGTGKQGPQQFAESMGEVEQLHTEIAKYVAEDATRSYEGQKLHRELETVTEGWQQALQAPAKQAAKLTESNGKLMRVIKAVADTGLTYKTKLAEALKRIEEQQKLIAELTQRGRGWMQLAETRKDRHAVLESKYQTSCEALDIMAERFHEDTTELSRRLIVLEFAEKAQAPEVQKALKEATRMTHIASIREKLEGKKPASVTEGQQAPKPGAKQTITSAPVVEGTNSAKAETPKPVTEGRVLMNEIADPRGLNESVALVQRLSASR